MIGCDALAHQGKREYVVGQANVLAQETNGDDDYQWIHENPLIPTEIAGQIVADFAEI